MRRHCSLDWTRYFFSNTFILQYCHQEIPNCYLPQDSVGFHYLLWESIITFLFIFLQELLQHRVEQPHQFQFCTLLTDLLRMKHQSFMFSVEYLQFLNFSLNESKFELEEATECNECCKDKIVLLEFDNIYKSSQENSLIIIKLKENLLSHILLRVQSIYSLKYNLQIMFVSLFFLYPFQDRNKIVQQQAGFIQSLTNKKYKINSLSIIYGKSNVQFLHGQGTIFKSKDAVMQYSLQLLELL